MPLVSEFRKQRQEDLFEFKASLVSTASFRIKEGREGKGKEEYLGFGGCILLWHTYESHRTTCSSHFSFDHVGLRDKAWVIKLGGKCFSPLSHLTSP